MKIVCIGGGPAGLYFALLMKQLNPAHQIQVIERNRPYDTFGWGVVFSDATMDRMREWDAVTADQIQQAFNHWDDIELLFKGRTIRSGGHGFVGIGRKKLLNILQARCEALGVELVFETDAESDLQYPDADLVIASDGINSRVRMQYAQTFRPDIVTRPNRYIWLGTQRLYDAFTFDFQRTEHGWFQAHIYKFDESTTTFIVECPEQVWLAHGLDQADQADSIAFCERLFANTLQGEKLMTNARHLRGSAWLNFQRVVCEQWWLKNAHGSHVVLMGDAVHTAHFAIGSGTKLALEDAIELVQQFKLLGDEPARLGEVLACYQAARSIETLRIQNAAWNAMEWFEVCGARYCDQLEPEQFMYSMLTRSQRISHENLRLRDAAWLEGYERWFAQRAQAALAGGAAQPMALQAPAGKPVPPMFTPLRVRDLRLKNRVVVSPMAQYSAADGVVGDYHLVHLGARALGGAALVMAEMTCTSPEARITPGCPGLWNDTQAQAWGRIVQWVHANSDAAIGVQIGHAGPKGSTCVPWQGGGMDQALPDGNWGLLAASARPYLAGGQVPRAMSRADMDRVKTDFIAAAGRAAEAGFDWLELHCAHGYLLSSFISPLTNHREDEYGGSLENRLRYPLEVCAAVRGAWPADRPMSVRISAHDWVDGGLTPADAVEVARAFKAAGADLIDVSSGQVSPEQKPTYGRMYQTPFADRIRQEAGIATMAVGAISEADHVNSIIAAGRADLCAVGRPHLANPAWTLAEAARIGHTPIAWPKQLVSGKSQMEALAQRAAQQAVK
ncbi:bifunctional salicylyl-CoA 5-hydroxylase/oxidoreductase [Ideonella sp. 4Y11]|uniref:Bifunctional salicylyl-CoA 5-hydroxylase/oxidoreductase n=1 Tax=Ideonella aquatica TaxID=2824119 RepID=A0A941BJH8_9BURK|nr:bifunctional salicylyl-CoA 5-hydroxylase/oxidoreductase [Ideonella aquatica]MBQ0958888.1 bifunctional salicylyl-CoA 5-hydroxylase/oxidoreductase [Ideonella aquatica]